MVLSYCMSPRFNLEREGSLSSSFFPDMVVSVTALPGAQCALLE